jgi:hypothetical protein
MSTQSDSSPGFSNEVGGGIELAEGLAEPLADALGAVLAGVEGDAAVLGEPPVVQADAITPEIVASASRRFSVPVTISSSIGQARERPSQAHLYHL